MEPAADRFEVVEERGRTTKRAAGTAFLVALGVLMLLLGAGVGMAETVSNELILWNAPPAKAGAASAVSETAYELGAALGIAVLGTILTSWYRHAIEIPPGLSPDVQANMNDSISSAIQSTMELPADVGEQVLAASRAAFSSAFTVTCLTASFVMFIAVVLAYRVLPSHAEERDIPAE